MFIERTLNGSKYICYDVNIIIPYSYVMVIEDYLKMSQDRDLQIDLSTIVDIVNSAFNDLGCSVGRLPNIYSMIPDWIKHMLISRIYYSNKEIYSYLSKMLRYDTKLSIDALYNSDNRLGNDYYLFLTFMVSKRDNMLIRSCEDE